MVSKTERLLTLLHVLMSVERPIEAQAIRLRVPGYPPEMKSFQRQFERDKVALKDMGLDVQVSDVPGAYPPVAGYRIQADRALLKDPGLEVDELAALHLAASAVRLEGAEALGGLWKLGGSTAGEGGDGVVDLPMDERVITLFQAITERRAVAFDYRGEKREVEPWRLSCQRGRWYVTGLDRGRGEQRHFRLDRVIGEVTTGPAGGFDAPAGPVDPVGMEAWQFGSDPSETVRVAVEPDHSAEFQSLVPSATLLETRASGELVLEVQVSDFDAFRSLLLGFLQHAVLLEPAHRRDEMIAWLEKRGRFSERMKVSTAEKLGRIISMVSWINRQDGPTISEVCDRFSIGSSELISQLEMASMIGDEVGPHADMPIELYFEGERIYIHLSAFERPLRLSAEQALALLVAGSGVTQAGVPRSATLEHALDKVAAAVGLNRELVPVIELGDVDSSVLETLRLAAANHEAILLDYWSAGRDRRTERVVEPWQVFNDAGAWYLQGFCRLANDERVFRLDRIRALKRTSERFSPPQSPPPAAAYTGDPEERRVVLDLDPSAQWVLGMYPLDSVEHRESGVVRVTMPSGPEAFLARLLLRLGPAATVVSSDDESDTASVVSTVALSILRRYEASN